MKIKNISGSEQYFHLFGTKGIRLANNATSSFIEDNSEALQNVSKYVERGLVELAESPQASELAQVVDIPVGVAVTLADVGDAADTLTIAGVVFELYANGGSYSGTNVGVEMGAATATQTATALKTAISANTTLKTAGYRVAAQSAGVLYVVRADGDATTAITTAETGDTFTIAALAGSDGSNKGVHISTHDPGGDTPITVLTGLKTVDTVVVQARTSAGVIRTGVATIVTVVDGGLVTVDPDSGTWADNDVVTVVAYGTKF